MSKAFHLTAGLGCSCLQHFVLETWGWPHMGKGNSSSRRILLGKVPSLMTCESKKFCETHFFFGPAGPGQGSDRFVLWVPRGGGWPRPCLEALKCFLSPGLSQPALT